MVVIRNVFRLKFGKAREAVPLFKEGLAIQKKVGAGSTSPLDCSPTSLVPFTQSFWKSRCRIWLHSKRRHLS